MEPERQNYKGHRIELRAPEGREEVLVREAEREEELELLIDDQPVRYGQLPDGRYTLEGYAYDWRDNLMDLARRFTTETGWKRSDAKPSPVGRTDMGVRKNYCNLTDVERDRFVQALLQLKADGIVDQFAEIHRRHFLMNIHRSSHFLPWHREMLLRFERELQEVHPDITIPYWDSSVDRSASDPL